MLKYPFLILALIAGMACFSAAAANKELPPLPDPVISYFPVLPSGDPQDETTQLIPVVSNHLMEGAHPGLTRAIVVIHDSSRNAQGTFTILSALAGNANQTTIIMAPQFVVASDIDRYYIDVPQALLKRFESWKLDAWIYGGDSLAEPPQRSISSFAVLDLMLVYLSEKEFFPDLKEIVVAGHGAGADFVQRYAAIGRAPPILENGGLPVHFLVANAASYLYLTASRPKANSLGFATVNSVSCGHFNDYSYGLMEANGYTKRVGDNAIKTNYGNRSVTYLVGENMPSADPFPDASCQAMLQGANREAREINYSRYIAQLYGEEVDERQKFYVVPKVAYDPVALFASPCGMATLFGNTACSLPTVREIEIPR